MAMGFNAATNIHQQILEKLTGKEPKFVEFPEVPPMIGLAIGKKAVSYSPGEGTDSGEHVMKMFFGDDLGFTSKYSSSIFAIVYNPSLTCHFSLLELPQVVGE